MAKKFNEAVIGNKERRTDKLSKKSASKLLMQQSASTGKVSTRKVAENTYAVRKDRINHLSEIGYSKVEIHRIVAPPRTLNRREDTLSLEESDRVQRLERTLEHASRVFGSTDKANKWLRNPNRALTGAKPIELLVSETGAHEIEMQLHAIDYGMYA